MLVYCYVVNYITYVTYVQLLIKFFSEVDQLVNSLGSNMWFIIGRSLEMVKGLKIKVGFFTSSLLGSESGSGPQELVTCLRIVEREERYSSVFFPSFFQTFGCRIDRYYESGDASVKTFVPPNRPRRWKEKALSVCNFYIVNTIFTQSGSGEDGVE